MATGRDFTLRVRLAATSGGDGGSIAADGEADGARDGAAGGAAGGVFDLLFRPADTGQLRTGMPHIGVPAFVDEGEQPGEAGEEGGDDGVSTTRDMVTATFGPSPSKSGRTPVYYFALVKGRGQPGSAVSEAAQSAGATPAATLDPAAPSTALGSEAVGLQRLRGPPALAACLPMP